MACLRHAGVGSVLADHPRGEGAVSGLTISPRRIWKHSPALLYTLLSPASCCVPLAFLDVSYALLQILPTSCDNRLYTGSRLLLPCDLAAATLSDPGPSPFASCFGESPLPGKLPATQHGQVDNTSGAIPGNEGGHLWINAFPFKSPVGSP